MFLLPLLLACAVGAFRGGKRWLALALSLIALLATATLALTHSRAGWIGFAVAVAALVLALIWLNAGGRGRKALAIATIALVAGGLLLGAIALPRVLNGGQDAVAVQGDAVLQQLSLDARIEIWSRALYALQDFPFTGVGLGAFRRVVNVLYPLFLMPPDVDIAHSHNMFLQVGVDLGLIGLVGYVALLIVAAASAWQIASTGRGFAPYLALGALAALIGLHVYGLADALALGSKPSVIFWVVLGLVAALAAAQSTGEVASPAAAGQDLGVRSQREADEAPAAMPG